MARVYDLRCASGLYRECNYRYTWRCTISITCEVTCDHFLDVRH